MENVTPIYLKRGLKYLLFATALTPLVVTHSTLFPFITGKIFFFRSLVEVALIIFLVTLILEKEFVGEVMGKIKKLFRNPLAVFLSLFLLSLIVSTIFAVNHYRAFCGDIERGDGLFGMLHFFAFLLMTVTVFDRRDWTNYLKATLVVGAVMIFYAFLQFFDITNFPFMSRLANHDRAESFIGNSAFLAAYLILLVPFAVVVYQHESAKIRINQWLRKFWPYFSLAVIFLSFITIFLTGTRGAILGLGAGVLFLLLYFTFRKAQIHTDNKEAQINTDKKQINTDNISVSIRQNPCPLVPRSGRRAYRSVFKNPYLSVFIRIDLCV